MTLPPPSGFKRNAVRALEDRPLREAVRKVTDRFVAARSRAFPDAAALEDLRERGQRIRSDALAHLDGLLELLETRIRERGGQVHWAADAGEACRIVLDLFRRSGGPCLVKGKSMTTEEIGLNGHLLGQGVRPVETDLGEYILQLAHDSPAHIIVPAIRYTRRDVSGLFERHLGSAPTDEIPRLTATARRALRGEFLSAKVGLTGVNLAVAETGTLVVVENEGNGRFCNTRPGAHIAVMGIEKVIRRFRDLDVMLKLLIRSATGQPITSYVNLLTGPRRPGESDGPEALHLVLVDNGRARLLADPLQQEALRCVRCGACLNACPVYGRLGGHAYGWAYPGPIGSVITPAYLGLSRAADLPFASTLCGACKDVCPVRIDLPRLLLDLRGRATREPSGPRRGGRWAFRLWGWCLATPSRYRWAGRFLRWASPLRLLLPGNLTGGRRLPAPAPRSFLERWEAGER